MSVNIDGKFAQFADHWSPKIIGQFNDLHIKAVKVKGEFVWHSHPETDELFLVHKGELFIDYRDRRNVVRAGEFFVVPRGVEHRPVAVDECEMLLIEPAGTVNTGDAGGERTVDPKWI
ncbi:MAG: cupin domain-containing protein [Acidobacteriaceae bacterium]|nr:cupin domain-containing protein [Acidobacteriaceae bacterium]